MADDERVEPGAGEDLAQAGPARGEHAHAELRGKHVQRIAITLEAPAPDRRHGKRAHDRDAPMRLLRAPRLDVGDVDFDERRPERFQRVPDRPLVVRPGAGIDDRAVDDPREAVDVLEERALMVGLEAPDPHAPLAPHARTCCSRSNSVNWP